MQLPRPPPSSLLMFSRVSLSLLCFSLYSLTNSTRHFWRFQLRENGPLHLIPWHTHIQTHHFHLHLLLHLFSTHNPSTTFMFLPVLPSPLFSSFCRLPFIPSRRQRCLPLPSPFILQSKRCYVDERLRLIIETAGGEREKSKTSWQRWKRGWWVEKCDSKHR